VALFVGFSVVPLSVWLGILKVVEHQ
jgi:hypothetical protein